MIMASDKTSAMTDLEDLNRTLYDIGAQDLLDVWEAMESENGSTGNSWDFGSSGLLNTPVLKDRLLTDSIGVDSAGEEGFPVNAEHSYSLGGSNSTANSTFNGSDGDSMPESPLSLDDDMETECYPCIPMHSASNQKRMNHSTVTMIKPEPLSEDVNVNIVDHEDNTEFRNSSSLRKTTRNRRSLIATASNNTTTTTSQQQHRMHQHTIRLSRPKHPQSLLKQKPVTHTILVTTTNSGSVLQNSNTYSVLASSTSGTKVSSSSSCSSVSSDLGCNSQVMSDHYAPDLHASLISSQPTDGCGVLILTEEEKKTLISEGYPIPAKLPLTKAEEKSLKKIRRKIKNKISAQESRRKKKEFVDTLEKRVELAVQELEEYKKKCEFLQKQNTSLKSQLKSLRNVANNNAASIAIKPDPDFIPDVGSLGADVDLDLD
eukprot:12200.XXX_766739_758395_1 [CDS] Oithona nana genome sequencing.